MTQTPTHPSLAWLACVGTLAACGNASTPSAQLYSASDLQAITAADGGSADDGEHPLDGLAPAPVMKWISTERIGQLTGTSPNPLTPIGMSGTDLGVSFQRNDKLYFLFGDSLIPGWKKNPIFPPADLNLDSVASTSVERQPNEIPQLDWVRRNNGKFLPFVLDGRRVNYNIPPLKEMSVPVEGLTLDDDTTYVFFHVVPKNGSLQNRLQNAFSVLAHTTGADFANMQVDHVQPNSKFRSVSTVRTGNDIWIYGAEVYRNSPVWLAHATTETLQDRTRWEYYTGLNPQSGEMLVANDESGASPLVDESCVGELSVRKHPTRDLYFMTYNCGPDGNHSVLLRTATHPAGPWSAAVQIYSTAQASFVAGHGHVKPAPDDQDGTSGDIYGPYLVPQWFQDREDGKIELVYTLSSWIPYQIHLMRTVIEPVSSDEPPAQGN